MEQANDPVCWDLPVKVTYRIKNSMKGLNISISLSEPLLSLRQRADTVNTLLVLLLIPFYCSMK